MIHPTLATALHPDSLINLDRPDGRTEQG